MHVLYLYTQYTHICNVNKNFILDVINHLTALIYIYNIVYEYCIHFIIINNKNKIIMVINQIKLIYIYIYIVYYYHHIIILLLLIIML